MHEQTKSVLLKRSEILIIALFVIIRLVLHLVLKQNYGYFRDEFLYMKLGEKVFDGPIDMPLFAPLLMSFTLKFVGDSLLALHVFPALAGAFVVVVTILMTRELGGKSFAQILAGTCSLLAPVNLGSASIFSYDCFDQLFWTLCFYFLVKLLKHDDPKYWIHFGIAAGLGLFTKQSMLFLGFAVAVAFLLTSYRKYYRTRWIWLGAAIAFIFFIPYLVMQAKLGWPLLEYWLYYTNSKTYPVSPVEFLLFQIMTMNPVSLPVWLAGLWFAFQKKPGRNYRPLALTYVILFGFFLLIKAKFYFLAPAYPFLFAAGAVLIEEFAQRRIIKIIAFSHLAFLVITGFLFAPFGMSLLPVEKFIELAKKTNGKAEVKQERLEASELPAFFADCFGWEELAEQVARVYHQLPVADQQKACIFTGNYGEAGAIEFWGKKRGFHLPPVISGHGQYHYWGCGDCTGEILIVFGISRKDLEPAFGEITEVARTNCRYAMLYENNKPIFVCRQLKRSIKELWPNARHLD